MKPTLAIAAYEVRARRQLLVVAFAIGSFPLLASFLPDVTPTERVAIAKGLLALLTVVLAPLLGASVLAPELAGRRLAFYLTRPLGTTALVSGKALGTVAILAAAQVLALGPTAVVDPADAAGGAGFWLGLATTSCALFAAGLAAGFLLRLPSRLVLLDAAALLICGGLLAILVHRWEFLTRLERMQRALPPSLAATLGMYGAAAVGAGALALVWLSAAALGVARGRTDGERVHRTVSAVGWSGTLVVLLALVVLPEIFWHRRALEAPIRVRSSGGGWIVLDNPPRAPRFQQLGSQRLRTPPWELRGSYTLSDARVARAAPVAAWIRHRADWLGHWPTRTTAVAELVSLDLGAPSARLRRLPLNQRSIAGWLDVSPDGTKVVVVNQQGDVRAIDLATGAAVFEGRGPDATAGTRLHSLVFATPKLVRMYATAHATPGESRRVLEIHELDLTRGSLRRTSTVDDAASERWRGASFDGARVWTVGDDTASVRDAASGQLQHTYRLDSGAPRAFAVLSDGALVLAQWRHGRVHVRLGTEGTWHPPIDVGPALAPHYPHLSSVDPASRKVYVRLAADREVLVDLQAATDIHGRER